MLLGIFRTKVGKILTVVFALTVIIAVILIFKGFHAGDRYEDQAVMAERYLREGNYTQAADAYLKALSMKENDQEKLTLGLAEAYAGAKDFDSALEVLRSYFQKNSGNNIKEKIEEVTSQKADYEYLQIISRADAYFDNKEYSKAITEYEKAKQIKSKEVASYQRIAEAYIQTGDYDKALEEAQQGLDLTQSEELERTLNTINVYITKQKYDKIISDAAEYIAQENYKDGIKKYIEAIRLLPEEEQAYSELAQVYLDLKQYQEAASLLSSATDKIRSDKLQGLLDEANEYLAEIKERNKTLSELYHAVNSQDIKTITDLINTEEFKGKIAADFPVYYSPKGEEEIVNGAGLIIYDSYDFYSGEIQDGIKDGEGIFINLAQQYGDGGGYYYQGEWCGNIPNGTGTTTEITAKINKDNETVYKKTVTQGSFYKGVENGSMHKFFYENDSLNEDVSYSALNGEPLPMTDESGQLLPTEEGEPYAIGQLYRNGKLTKEYYYVKPLTYWGVKPFLGNQ